jgi:acyl carrier protein
LDRKGLFLAVSTEYAQALEYPVDVFADDVLLEAELGVDSVKQIELLTRVSATYGLPPRSDSFRLSDFDTLDKVVDYIHAMAPSREALGAVAT